MKRILLAVFISLAFLSPLCAYTYEDLYQSMLINNTDLREADQAIRMSHLDVKDAQANYHPQIELQGGIAYMINPLTDPLTINTNDILTQIGMQPLPTSYDVELWEGLDNTMYSLSVNLTQPLITWGKLPNAVNMYKELEGVKQIQKTDLEKQLTVQLKAMLAALYYIDDVLGYLESTVSITDELVSYLEKSGEEGMVLNEDVVEARVSASEANLGIAELRTQRTQLLQTIRALTGIPDLQLADIEYVPDEEEWNTIMAYSLDSLIELATSDSSAAMQMLTKAGKALDYGEYVANASMYGVPDLALQLSFSLMNSRFPGEIGWSSTNEWSFMGMLGFKTTLWDGGKILNNRERIRSQKESNDIRIEDTRNTLAATVTENYSNAELSFARIDYLEAKADSSSLKLDNSTLRNNAGADSRADVLQNQIDVNTDLIELTKEKISLSQYCYTLYYLSGIDPDNPPVITDGGTIDYATE